MSERGYLDGVPMRLNSKFYPQPRPQFKEIDIHIPIDALQDDYDFSVERSVLIEVSAWQEHKRLEDERRAEEAKRRAEEEERKRIEDEQKRLEEEERRKIEDEKHRRFEEERKILEEEERQKFEIVEEKRRIEEKILEEEQRRLDEERKIVEDQERRKFEKENNRKYEEETKRKFEDETKRKVEEEIRRKLEEKASRINLSDFESDTANPFDNVELKSINEMEMLASVLKNNSSSVPVAIQNLEYRSDPHITNTNYMNGGPSLYCNQGSTQASSCFPGSYNVPNSYPVQQWNTNSYFASPSAPHIPGRLNSPVTVPTQMTDQSNIPASTANSFTKYYFPLLTSMADTRSMRDRQNQFSNNLNQGYHSQPLPPSGISNNTTSGSTENQNPFLSNSQSTLHQFPVQGSLSHQPPSHYWPNGASMTLQNTYNVANNPTPNGPLANDPLHKSNNSHSPSSTNLSSTSNGTQHTLR